MGVIQTIAMLLVGVFATGVVLTREPIHQAIAMGPFVMAMVILFTVLQAPDVVLSAIVVGLFAYPVMVLLTLAKVHHRERES